jgi:hypothetical protein
MRFTITGLLALLLAAAASADTGDSSPTITSVVMHRSACYGTCPVYTVELTAAGSVTYTGEEHVAALGRKSAHIDASEFQFLVTAIERMDFFSLHEKYRFKPDGCPEWSTDNPTVDIVVTRGSQKKHVSYYYGCRGMPIAKRIIWLSDTIDDVAGTAAWVGSDDAL